MVAAAATSILLLFFFPPAIGTLHGQEVVEGGGCLHLGRCAWHGCWWGSCSLGKDLGLDFCQLGFGAGMSDRGKAQGLGEQCPAQHEYTF